MKKAWGWLLGAGLCAGTVFGADEMTLPEQNQPDEKLKLEQPAKAKPALSPNSVAVKAQVITAKDTKESGDRGKRKQLAITVNRTCKEELGDCVIKWSLIGRDVSDNRLSAIGSGDITVSLTNRLPQCVTSTPPVAINYTPTRRGGGAGGVSKTIHASGYRLSGWSVQVYQESNLVGERFDPPSLKSDMAKQAEPKPAKGEK